MAMLFLTDARTGYFQRTFPFRVSMATMAAFPPAFSSMEAANTLFPSTTGDVM